MITAKQFVETNWNSLYKMILKIVEFVDDIDSLNAFEKVPD